MFWAIVQIWQLRSCNQTKATPKLLLWILGIVGYSGLKTSSYSFQKNRYQLNINWDMLVAKCEKTVIYKQIFLKPLTYFLTTHTYHTNTHTHTHTRTHTHTLSHKHTHTCMHTCTHKHKQIKTLTQRQDK